MVLSAIFVENSSLSSGRQSVVMETSGTDEVGQYWRTQPSDKGSWLEFMGIWYWGDLQKTWSEIQERGMSSRD